MGSDGKGHRRLGWYFGLVALFLFALEAVLFAFAVRVAPRYAGVAIGLGAAIIVGLIALVVLVPLVVRRLSEDGQRGNSE